MNTPIYNKLKELDSEKRIPFHMPGHKRTDFGAFFDIEKMDITEITDYDNLHEPEGIIRESMDLVKDIYLKVQNPGILLEVVLLGFLYLFLRYVSREIRF